MDSSDNRNGIHRTPATSDIILKLGITRYYLCEMHIEAGFMNYSRSHNEYIGLYKVT